MKRAIDGDRYFLSPRVRVLQSILGRLEPQKPAPPPGAVLCAATGYGKAAAGAGMTTARPMMWACPAKASVVI